MAELADALDSKSSGTCAHVGSIPTFGTNYISMQRTIPIWFFFMFLYKTYDKLMSLIINLQRLIIKGIIFKECPI